MPMKLDEGHKIERCRGGQPDLLSLMYLVAIPELACLAHNIHTKTDLGTAIIPS
jgi:hypothetical protein